MASPFNPRPLVATFVHGIVVTVALAAASLHIKTHGSAAFRDGRRLAAAVFFVASALAVQTSFIETVIPRDSSTGCQIAIGFSSSFDQIARISLEQLLLWTVRGSTKVSVQMIAAQLLLLVRFALGGVFVGFQRPQFKPFCVSSSQVLPLGVSVLGVDAVIIGILTTYACLSGRTQDVPRSKAAAIWPVMGLLIWTASSVPMLLGMRTMDLAARTIVPTVGLLVAIAMSALFKEHLLVTGDQQWPGLPSTNRLRSAKNSGDLRIRHVPNEEANNSDSSSPPSRYEELKEDAATTVFTEAYVINSNRGERRGPLITSWPNIEQYPTVFGGPAAQNKDLTFSSSSSAGAWTEGQPQHSRKIFKVPKKTGGKLNISHPVLIENADQNPLRRMPTVDLGTAAKREQDRRKQMAAQSLFANATMTSSIPTGPTLEAMRRMNSFTRKEVAAPKNLLRDGPAYLEPLVETRSTVTSSSVQLSPAIDDMRRRSPRPPMTPPSRDSWTTTPLRAPKPQSEQADIPLRPARPEDWQLPSTPPNPTVVQTALDLSPMGPKRLKSGLASSSTIARPGDARSSMAAQSRTVRVEIRPSRPAPSPPLKQSPNTNKTPIQMRPTTGLPRTPRAQAMKAHHLDQDMPREQTVMFVNHIEYNDVGAVKQIIERAKGKSVANAVVSGFTRSASVVNRPRPIPRKPEADRSIFPAEESPNVFHHRRSLSGGSIRGRRSTQFSAPTTPMRFPLPPGPKSADLARYRPNSSKSMTFDEKMDIFYPTSPNTRQQSSVKSRRRSSSVPEVPALPEHFLTKTQGPVPCPKDISKTADNVTPRPKASDKVLPATPQNIEKSVRTSTTGSQPSAHESRRHSERSHGSKRQSSPILPPDNLPLSPQSIDNEESSVGVSTRADAGHSYAQHYTAQKAQKINVKATTITAQRAAKVDIPTSELSQTVEREQQNMVIGPNLHSRHGETYRLSWRRRVGEECPTFSDRNNMRSRKMPPPAPLALHRSSQISIIVPSEPSPLESPTEAFQLIQAQLDKLDHAEQETIDVEQQRMTLLASLEQEVGMQEHQWQQMRNGMTRDSMSTTTTSPRREVLIDDRDSLPPPPKTGDSTKSISLKRRESRRAQLRDRGRDNSLLRTSGTSAVSDYSDASKDHRRLQHTKKVQSPLINPGARMNLSPFRAVTSLQLGSPTPPDTDESDNELEPERISPPHDGFLDVAQRPSLWHSKMPPVKRNSPVVPCLWTPRASTMRTRACDPVFAGLPCSRRPFKPRAPLQPLRIFSSQLWTQRAGDLKVSRRDVGLWKPAATTDANEGSPQKSRSRTQRPTRRSRRATVLPDILEDPEPLPDSQGNLGLFQFPWGERSDVPIIRPSSQALGALPGTMASGSIMAQTLRLYPFALEASGSGYSSSFFDDYDEEDQGDNFSDSSSFSNSGDEEDGGDDDDFDETTLWEIASLLKSNEVPSRGSLFPDRSISRLQFRPDTGTYELEPQPESPMTDSRHASIPMLLDLGQEGNGAGQAVAQTSKNQQGTMLWRPDEAQTRQARHIGLPQPDKETWQAYVVSPTPIAARSIDNRPEPSPLTLESMSLWEPRNDSRPQEPRSLLWSSKQALLPEEIVERRAPESLISKAPLKKTDVKQDTSPTRFQDFLTSLKSPFRRGLGDAPALPLPRPAPSNTLEPPQPLVPPRGDDQPLRRQDRPAVSPEEWDAALQEALSAGLLGLSESRCQPSSREKAPLLPATAGSISTCHANEQPSPAIRLWSRPGSSTADKVERKASMLWQMPSPDSNRDGSIKEAAATLQFVGNDHHPGMRNSRGSSSLRRASNNDEVVPSEESLGTQTLWMRPDSIISLESTMVNNKNTKKKNWLEETKNKRSSKVQLRY